MEQNVRSRGNKPAPPTTVYGGDAPRAGGGPPPGHEELKALIEGYKGFGILSLIRALMLRGDLRSFMLSLVGIVLLLGQWTGPVGFIAFKFTTEDMEFCTGGAGKWARCVMASVAMIYFARLSLASLSHRQKLPREFDGYKIPKWWSIYRHADLVVTSLLYDTFIFLANLLIVFQDRAVNQMVVDVLALEFFTLIDDEFKAAVLEYDSTFLDDMLYAEAPSELTGPARPGEYGAPSSSWMPSQQPRSALTEALFESGGDDRAEDRSASAGTDADPKTCCDLAVKGVLAPIKGVLIIVRVVCRIGGPVVAFLAIFYGPVCLGAP